MGFFQNLTGWHFLILALVVLLIFGATRLPALAKSMGQSMKIFKNEIKSDDPAENADGTAKAEAPKPEDAGTSTTATK
jgi:sec-independent protein translocase protein TatA